VVTVPYAAPDPSSKRAPDLSGLDISVVLNRAS
jgi:hypothetical protein